MSRARWRPGIVLAHKPVGTSSHAIVRAALEDMGEKKLRLCHGGTLDPFAEGLLLLLVGHATKLQGLLHALPKTYEATISWGRETETGDLHGKTSFEGNAAALSPARLNEALVPFLGWQHQVPPATSAKKIAGEPAYKKAHRGEAVELPPSRVYLHEAHWRGHELPQRSHLRIVCRGGYYVRSLARDLGRALTAGAHVEALKRTQIGPWQDEDASTRVPIVGADVVPWCRRRALRKDEYHVLRARGRVPAGELQDAPWAPPPGFPDPPRLIAGTVDERLTFLLEERREELESSQLFLGGI